MGIDQSLRGFKCESKRTESNGKGIALPNCIGINKHGSSHFSLDLSKLFRNRAKFDEYRNSVVSNFHIRIGSFIFFIQRRFTKKHEIETKLNGHYVRLNENVFKKWTGTRFETVEAKYLSGEFPEDLLLHITPILEASEYHSKAESHLETYSNATEYIKSIRTNEKTYNKIVFDYFGEIDSIIVSKFYEINSSIHECGDDNDAICYVLETVKSYLFRSARKIPLSLIITDTDAGGDRVRLKIDSGRSLIAIADHETLKKVKNLLDSSLKPEIINKVEQLLKERNDIAKTYTEDLLPIVKDIVTDITEELPLRGKCSLKYCSSS